MSTAAVLSAFATFLWLGCSETPSSSSGTRGGGSAGEAGENSGGASSGSGGGPAGGNGNEAGGGDTGTGDSGGSAGAGGGGDSGAGGTGGTDAGLPLDEFCELLQLRARNWLRECRPNFGNASGWWGTQNIDRLCESGREAVEAGRLTYDAQQARACAEQSIGDCNAIDAFAYGDLGQQGWLRSSACHGVLTGAVPLGSDCHSQSTGYSSECSEGFCTTNSCPGVCSAYTPPGDRCDQSLTRCDPATSFCNQAGECQLYLDLGETCTGAQCDPADLCRFHETEQTETCVATIAPGGTCDAALEQCADGLACHEAMCTGELPLGAPCFNEAHCPDGAYCEDTCQERVIQNGDCSGGEQCVESAYCDGSVCLALGGGGDACPCEPGLWCDDLNVCQEPRAVGDDCEQSSDTGAFNRCTGNLQCVPSGVDTGVPSGYECQAPGAEGDFCLPRYPSSCQFPLFCNPQAFICEPPGSETEPCNQLVAIDSCEPGLFCECTANCTAASHEAVGECSSQAADTEPCSQDVECASGSCQGGTTCAPNAECL